MLRITLVLILTALLAACASRAPDIAWPDDIPPRAQFSAEWQRSTANQPLQDEAEYLLWVTRFYNGYGAVPGWLAMTEQVLQRVDEAERAVTRARLFELGGRIGAEWAKDNSVRKLTTRSAGVWRDALLEALSQGELGDYLDRLSMDVDALLAGELDNEAIVFERYYVDEFDF